MRSLFFLAVALCATICVAAQCPDATSKKYKAKVDRGENVQSCSQCAMLALYFCSATCTVKPDDKKKLTTLIANIKGNIRFMGSPICCPELLNKRPQWGTAVGGGGNAGSGASGGLGGVSKIGDNDMLEAATILATSLGAFALTMEALDQILPDPGDQYREAMSQYKYAWEEQPKPGKGKGSIVYLDPSYVFTGDISRGIAKKGKMKLGKYGFFEGEFEPKEEGGLPFLGSYITNFGVNLKFAVTPKNKLKRTYSFPNGDEVFFSGPLSQTVNYVHKSTGATYKAGRSKFENYHKSIDKKFPIATDAEVRDNYYRYLLILNLPYIAKYYMVGIKGLAYGSMMVPKRSWRGMTGLEEKFEIDEELKIWHQMVEDDLK